MTDKFVSLTPADVHARLAKGSAVLVDVREPDEFARIHIQGAVSQPLSGWDSAHLTVKPGADVIFTCKSGMRTARACDRLLARVEGQAFMLEGGLDGWAKAGFPIVLDKSVPIDLMRQVQITAGFLVAAGTVLGLLANAIFFAIPAFVGTGLIFAGVTGFCGMARLLALAPWNRRLKTA